jgi:hypothetical protein
LKVPLYTQTCPNSFNSLWCHTPVCPISSSFRISGKCPRRRVPPGGAFRARKGEKYGRIKTLTTPHDEKATYPRKPKISAFVAAPTEMEGMLWMIRDMSLNLSKPVRTVDLYTISSEGNGGPSLTERRVGMPSRQFFRVGLCRAGSRRMSISNTKRRRCDWYRPLAKIWRW